MTWRYIKKPSFGIFSAWHLVSNCNVLVRIFFHEGMIEFVIGHGDERVLGSFVMLFFGDRCKLHLGTNLHFLTHVTTPVLYEQKLGNAGLPSCANNALSCPE